MLSGINEQMTH